MAQSVHEYLVVFQHFWPGSVYLFVYTLLIIFALFTESNTTHLFEFQFLNSDCYPEMSQCDVGIYQEPSGIFVLLFCVFMATNVPFNSLYSIDDIFFANIVYCFQILYR